MKNYSDKNSEESNKIIEIPIWLVGLCFFMNPVLGTVILIIRTILKQKKVQNHSDKTQNENYSDEENRYGSRNYYENEKQKENEKSKKNSINVVIAIMVFISVSSIITTLSISGSYNPFFYGFNMSRLKMIFTSRFLFQLIIVYTIFYIIYKTTKKQVKKRNNYKTKNTYDVQDSKKRGYDNRESYNYKRESAQKNEGKIFKSRKLIECDTCGAKNLIASGELHRCEYCGSPLYFE